MELLCPSSLRSPPLLPAPPHPSPPPADGSDVAGRAAAQPEALRDVGGLCNPGDRCRPAAADGQAEESAVAGAQSQGEALSSSKQSRQFDSITDEQSGDMTGFCTVHLYLKKRVMITLCVTLKQPTIISSCIKIHPNLFKRNIKPF